ncbi:hypothetical protein EDB89DRAFT_2045521 [Lactarius sanguifluus]|nr:hypothetical protein EDB89DRAFT_2045521 [Lactarius sanguifluus]
MLLLHSVDTTVFGFSSGNLFDVDSVAKRGLIISSIAAAIGLFVDVWFILAYSGADVRKFQTLAVDLYGSYFFFALSSRLPLVALFVLALIAFLGAIAWNAWPAAVLVMCVLAGLLVNLQFIVYAATASPSALRGWCAVPGSTYSTFRACPQPRKENNRWDRPPRRCGRSSRPLCPHVLLDLRGTRYEKSVDAS